MAYDYALVALGGGRPPSAWNLYHSEADALAAMRQGHTDDLGGQPIRRYATVMPREEYHAAKRAYWLAPATNLLTPCTADQWMQALECLPPECWQRRDGVERFLMCEYLDGSVTRQYARLGELYASRLVDARDASTWITGDEMRARFAALREEGAA